MQLPREDGPLDVDSIERLEALRDRHRGETAVVIGNGPSLNETELELLTDVPTFGVNAIFLAQDRLPEPITYYVVEDTMVFEDNVAAIKAFAADWKLFPAMYRPAFEESELDDHTIFFRMNAGFYGRKTGTKCHPRFSLDATQRLYCGQSVTIINLQLAHWMGFQRVVLIGMDFTYRIPEDADRQGGADHVAQRRPQPLPPRLLRRRQEVARSTARPCARELPPRRRDLPGDRPRDRQRHRRRQTRTVPAPPATPGDRLDGLTGQPLGGGRGRRGEAVVVGGGALVVGATVVGVAVVVGGGRGASVVGAAVVGGTGRRDLRRGRRRRLRLDRGEDQAEVEAVRLFGGEADDVRACSAPLFVDGDEVGVELVVDALVGQRDVVAVRELELEQVGPVRQRR